MPGRSGGTARHLRREAVAAAAAAGGWRPAGAGAAALRRDELLGEYLQLIIVSHQLLAGPDAQDPSFYEDAIHCYEGFAPRAG